METALARPAKLYSAPDSRALRNWVLCWILLPNLGFWCLWIVGGPPRALEIVLTGVIGILTHRSSLAIKYAGFLVAMIYSVLGFISGLFNLSIKSLFFALEFAGELQPSASIEYLVCGVAVAVMLIVAWFALRRPTTLAPSRRIIVAACLVLIAAGADVAMSKGNRGSYKRIPDPGTPFTSAVQRSGFDALATGRRHVVLIMVEAMGRPVDPALRARLINIWARPEVRERYDVASGDTLFYGSTTSGEMRELCGRWGDYPEVIETADPRCLPARLASKGYGTQAWHSFQGFFFDRTVWYPNIGFRQMRFGDRLLKDGATACPGVFPGACDRDVPRQIAYALKKADRPQFLYWLTVNSHLPVVKSDSLGTSQCSKFDEALNNEHPMSCRLLDLFDQTGRELAREITASDFPDADILIVGDHIPPFFDRSNRDLFTPDRVPWILLRPKSAPDRDDLHIATPQGGPAPSPAAS